MQTVGQIAMKDIRNSIKTNADFKKKTFYTINGKSYSDRWQCNELDIYNKTQRRLNKELGIAYINNVQHINRLNSK